MRLGPLRSPVGLGPLFEKRGQMYQPTLGEDLKVVQQDHCVKTHPANNKKRRTLMLKRENGSWGFTIQSYGIHHKTKDEIEHLTYVDYVEIGGAAYMAGMRKGDIILSINGQSMENTDHHAMVNFIKACGDTMRMVVLFEDCSRKVELHLRYIKLKKLLAAKEFELNSINNKIQRVNEGKTGNNPHDIGMASSSSMWSLWDDSWGDRPDLDVSHVSGITTLPRSTGHSKPHKSLSASWKPPTCMTDTHRDEVTTPDNPPKADQSNDTECDSSTQENSCQDESPVQNTDIPTSCHNNDITEDLQTASSTMDTTQTPEPSSYYMLPQNQFSSLPVRGQKKRPASLCIPAASMLDLSSHSRTNMHRCQSQEDNISRSDVKVSLARSLLSRSGMMRSRSFRASFRNSMSPASGESHGDSSNYVVTESNSRSPAEPELLRLKQGNLDLQSPVIPQDTNRRPPSLFRSFSSPNSKNWLLSLFDDKKKQTVVKSSIGSNDHTSNCKNCAMQNCAKHEYANEMLRRAQSISGSINSCHHHTPNGLQVSDRAQSMASLPMYSYNHGNTNCDTSLKVNNSDTPTTPMCSDKNCNRIPHMETPANSRITPHDSNGNSMLSPQLSPLDNHYASPVSPPYTQSNNSSILRSGSTGSDTRPWSTGSDVSMRSVSSRSSTGDASSPSSAGFEYYTDPFSLSPEDLTKKFPFPQRSNETPIVSFFKKSAPRRLITYSRHKDLLRQELRLVNINEDEETTKL